MSIITIDFETYYDKDFSLSKLTTEEYVNDPRFEVIGMGIKVDDGPAEWYTGEDIDLILRPKFGEHLPLREGSYDFRNMDWSQHAILCHNTLFDGAILSWKYGVQPGFWLDTLSMARALHGVDAGGSLKALAERYNIGVKGDEVVNAIGMRLADFDSAGLARYGAYCRNDVDLTYRLLHELRPFPDNEFKLINLTLRMFLQPTLEVNDALLVQRLEEVKQEKSDLLKGLMERLACETEEDVRKKLSSNPQFAELLKSYGITPPTKLSPATGKETWAFAKNDEGFIELTENEDPFIQQLCSVRLGTKSTIEESRIERFISIGARNRGRLPIPLKYYGAHTGRWSGLDSVNLQNLPSRDKKKKALKNSIVAPPGHVVINCDSSQIEARVLAWLAGQEDVVQQFAKGEDVYSIFASKVYKKEISKKNPTERFVGKTCLGIGSLVLSERGWIPIEQIRVSDRVWDGVEWVCHSGVVLNGTKETLQISGLWLTPDHQVWSGTWQRADCLQQDADTLSRALGIAAENLPSQAIWLAPEEFERSLSDVTAAQTNTQSITTTSRTSSLPAALYARSKQLVKSVTGNMQKLCQMMHIELDYLIVSQLRSPVAIHLPQTDLNITEVGEYLSTRDGEKTAQRSSGMCRVSPVGTILTSRWIGLTTIKGMNRGIFNLSRVFRTCTTDVKLRTLRPVYDILNCGSRNRFTVLTNDGPLIVHNCVLGLGYGTGAKKLQHTLKTQPPGADLPEAECKRIVDLYRSANHKIPALWHECDMALGHLAAWPSGAKEYSIGKHKALWITPEGIRLPNGLHIYYPKLHKSNDRFIYTSRKGIQSIWGGAMVENVVQALARIIVGEQMIELHQRGYRPVLTVHDAAVLVVDKAKIDDAMNTVIEVMSTPPDWATGLPVACEAKYGSSYGEC